MRETDVEWGPPPPARGPTSIEAQRKAEFVELLKDKPGEWARYPEPKSPTWATKLKSSFPGVQATARVRDDGKYDVWATWVGTE